MNLEELKQVKESLSECRPNVEDFSWGPTFALAEKRKKEALQILTRAIKECKIEKTKLTFNEVMTSVKAERDYQDVKWGSLDEKQQSIPGYLLILRKELEEAEDGWMKNVQGRDSSLAEIKQVAAVAIACLQQHGLEGN